MPTPVLVQSGDSGNSFVTSGSAATVFGSNVTVSDTVLLSVVVASPTDSVSSISSSFATTLTRLNSQNNGGNSNDMETWVALAATSAAKTVTVTTVSASNYTVCGQEWPGAAAAATGGLQSGFSLAGPPYFITITPGSGSFVLTALIQLIAGLNGAPSGWGDYAGAGTLWSWTHGFDVAWLVTTSSPVTATWTSATSGAAWSLNGAILYYPTSPTVSTEVGFSYGPTIEVLQATVNPDNASTTVSFSYGPTNSYGNTSASVTVPAGNSPVTVHIPITGLTLGNTYHYQCVATNSAGTTNGTDATFTTVGMPDVASGQGMGALGGAGMSGQPALPVLSNTTSQNYGPSIEVLSVTLTTGDEGNVVYFKYGPVTGSWGGSNWGAGPLYTLTSPSVTTVAGQTVVKIPVAGLVQGESYQFQAVVT